MHLIFAFVRIPCLSDESVLMAICCGASIIPAWNRVRHKPSTARHFQVTFVVGQTWFGWYGCLENSNNKYIVAYGCLTCQVDWKLSFRCCLGVLWSKASKSKGIRLAMKIKLNISFSFAYICGLLFQWKQLYIYIYTLVQLYIDV